MNYRDAKPGKPGAWNGQPMRWRTYKRSMKHHNKAAIERIAAAEIAIKEKHARRVARAVLIRNVLIAVGVVAAVVVRCAL